MLGPLSARLGGASVYIKVILGALLLTAVIACSSPSATPTTAPAATTAAAEEPAPTAEQEPATAAESEDTIKVGVLHSLSGTMSISETAVKDASLLAIDESWRTPFLVGNHVNKRNGG